MSEAALSRPGDIEAQRGATAESSERQRAGTWSRHALAGYELICIAGENYGDSSGKLWSMYLTEAEKQDKEITESWKGDTDGILVFVMSNALLKTGLFSATVAAFIIESYKQLSPDSGDTTVVLLTQISQQLVGISNGTRLQDFTPPSNQAFTPPASAIRVNIMWFLSLILSLTCALSATLMQQWARRYLELAQRRGAPHKRARIRAYIFDGIKGFKLSRAVETMPTLLHISVFLFFIGLFDFLLAIDHTVAFFVLGFIVAFAFAYLVLTALPNFFLNCPYRTPLSGFTWKISQILYSLSFFSFERSKEPSTAPYCHCTAGFIGIYRGDLAGPPSGETFLMHKLIRVASGSRMAYGRAS
ncbi:hypothetical protein BC834DRAFT_986485 [Gloeopeniophorella convolvens]|nr:hypothetical protein BC834DRAFT_986485 [Gloeopeniophorella convolvens]